MWIGKQIEILNVNHTVKSVSILVHLFCKPEDLLLPENGARASDLVRIGCKYLVDEGFIPPDPRGWVTHIGGIAHGTPK